MEPIDFVMPWVDGSDPVWLAEKRKYDPVTTDDGATVNRFRDWGLLPYWFRAVEKFTPWVNNVYFLTWGHLPSFLNTGNPKLHVVNHKDYIPEKYLPTFNSHTIELNAHRIKGLADRFVLLNDDTFIIRSMDPDRFFRNGKPCVYACETPVMPVCNELWQYIYLNDVITINRNFSKKEVLKKNLTGFLNLKYKPADLIRAITTAVLFPGKFLGFVNVHAPSAFLKKTFEEMWEKEHDLLDQTVSHKFRTQNDINQWSFSWWQAASGNFYPWRVDNEVMSTTEESIGEICDMITHQKHDMLCISDPDGDIDFDSLASRLKSAFEKILPEKSSFEK